MDARIRAAVTVAARHGVMSTSPLVLRDRSNLLVHLRPAPVVARIAAQTTVVRRGSAWLARETALAAFLAERDAPVVPPSPLLPAGPHEQDGFVLSFWTAVEEVQGPYDAAAAGRALRRCHDLLAGFEGPLPRWGATSEVEGLLERIERTEGVAADSARERLRYVLDGLERAAPTLQPVHGDAHLGNVLWTPDGPRWNDWEDAFAGPVGWDVACLLAGRPDPRLAEQAAAATGHRIEAEVLALLLEARRLQVAAWTVVLGRARGDAAMAEEGLTALRG